MRSQKNQIDLSKRKASQEINNDVHGSLKLLTQLCLQGIAVLFHGKVLHVNETLVELTGYSRKEIIDNNCLSICLPRKISRKIFRKSRREDSETFETTFITKAGIPKAIELEIQVLNYENAYYSVIGIRDISNRKRIEDEIVKLSIVLDQSSNEVIITRNNGEIEYVNRSFTKVTGYTPVEVIGKNPRILKSGMHPPEFYKQLWRTLLSGQQWEGEFRNRKKNGKLYWESATITPIRDKDHNIVRFLAIKEDITRRKEAEQSLRESEEKFRSMISNIPGVIYRCANDKDLTAYYITDAIEALTGYSAAEFFNNKSRSLASIIYPEDKAMVFDLLGSGIKSLHQFNIEYRILTRSNTIKWVSNSGRPAYNEDNSIKWLDGFLFDITEREIVLDELKKAKIAAEEANNAKSEFLANISHEIRTPLNSVLGFTEILEGLTTDPTQIKYLNSIKASGKNLMMLINDLLDLSKIEAGKMTLNYTFFDIRKLLDEIRNIFSLRVSIKGIGYKEILDKDFPSEIKFDEARLRQILINLVGNAVKFTHDGEITIKVRSLTKKVPSADSKMKLEIKVIDTGIGIPENSFKLIFDSFRQHSQLNSRKYGGTGLGLAITKRLVEAMNGKIRIESEVSKGSTFTINFTDIEYSNSASNLDVSQLVINTSHKKPIFSSASALDDKHELRLEESNIDLNYIKDKDYSALVRRFEYELYERWKLFGTKQPLKEIRSFAQDIILLGQHSHIDYITEYGEQLLTTIENFDIEEMRLKLDFFPDLLKKLKKNKL
jgi:PAS domain S-box-containing protein